MSKHCIPGFDLTKMCSNIGQKNYGICRNQIVGWVFNVNWCVTPQTNLPAAADRPMHQIVHKSLLRRHSNKMIVVVVLILILMLNVVMGLCLGVVLRIELIVVIVRHSVRPNWRQYRRLDGRLWFSLSVVIFSKGGCSWEHISSRNLGYNARFWYAQKSVSCFVDVC